MKRERGSEQHAEPVWKHERGEKGEKKGKGLWEGDDGCWQEEQASGRHERSWEGRKCGGENRYDYQGNSQNCPLLGRKRQRSV